MKFKFESFVQNVKNFIPVIFSIGLYCWATCYFWIEHAKIGWDGLFMLLGSLSFLIAVANSPYGILSERLDEK